MLLSVQVTSILILTFIRANAEAPPGYVKPAGTDNKGGPKYEYGYNIEDEKGAAHGKLEARDGIYALGRYYVQGADSTHSVQYYADDWGYHPYIEYSNVGPHSKTRTQLLIGVEAVKALASNKFTPHSVAPKHVANTISTKLSTRDGKPTSITPNPQPIPVVQQAQVVAQPQLLVQQEHQVAVPQQVLVEQHQQIAVQQPQVVVEQQQQHARVVAQPQVQVAVQPQVLVQQQHHVAVPQQILVQQQHHQIAVQQPQVLVEQQHQIAVQQPQQVEIQQPQQILEQRPQEISVQQPQVEQTQQIDVSQIQQNEIQNQQVSFDQSDSVVVEAAGRQSQQNLVQQRAQQQEIQRAQQQFAQQQEIQRSQQQFAQQQQEIQRAQQEIAQQQEIQRSQQQFAQQQQEIQRSQQQFAQQQQEIQRSQQQFTQQQQEVQQRFAQPQLEQVSLRQEVSYQQGQNVQQRLAQPQLEQVQFSQEISHQQLNAEPLPQALPLQSNLISDSNQQIQENLILNQQSETASLLENAKSSNQQVLQQSQANFGGFGSRINLLGRRRPTYNVRIQQNPQRLIENTQNLVSGQDVLNINGALDQNLETNIEASTARSLLREQDLASTARSSIGSSTISTVTESNLLNQPIIVADLDEKIISSTENYLGLGQRAGEQIYSTTASTVETVSSKSFGVTEPSTVLVTPRPVSTDFLAPITAGIQLQNVESSQNIATRLQSIESSTQKENYVVEVQKSLPLYLGKFEYEQTGSLGSVESSTAQSITGSIQQKAVENIELGKTLLSFESKSEQRGQQRGNGQLLQRQRLPELSVKENFVDGDQQQAQGVQHQVRVQQVSPPVVIEKVVEKEVPVPVVQTKIVEKPVQVTKIVREPYPVEVPVHIAVQVPVEVEKRVPVPVPVEKIVEKPVKEIVEKRIHIPQPYPVEKIVEKPVHIPIQVTKYVDRPYPVEVRVPQPYPVDRVVEKIVKQPYPVHVKVPVEVKVPVPVEKIVEKKVPVPQYVERRVPVDRIVEKKVPHYIDRPYPVQVQVPIPVANVYAVTLGSKALQGTQASQLVQSSQKYSAAVKTLSDYQKQELQGSQQLQLQQQLQRQLQRQQLQGQLQRQQQQEQQLQGLLQQNSFLQASTRNNEYLPPPPPQSPNNEYLPPHNCDQQNSFSSQNAYYTIQPDDYIGLSPPRAQENSGSVPRKFRNARSNFNSNLRVEYGFMPPLRPSQEIDENGKPITREEP